MNKDVRNDLDYFEDRTVNLLTDICPVKNELHTLLKKMSLSGVRYSGVTKEMFMETLLNCEPIQTYLSGIPKATLESCTLMQTIIIAFNAIDHITSASRNDRDWSNLLETVSDKGIQDKAYVEILAKQLNEIIDAKPRYLTNHAPSRLGDSYVLNILSLCQYTFLTLKEPRKYNKWTTRFSTVVKYNCYFYALWLEVYSCHRDDMKSNIVLTGKMGKILNHLLGKEFTYLTAKEFWFGVMGEAYARIAEYHKVELESNPYKDEFDRLVSLRE